MPSSASLTLSVRVVGLRIVKPLSSILEKFKLHERVALVTGASTGLGAAIAVALAEAGAQVACHGNTRSPETTCEQITSAGGVAFPIIGDLSTPETANHIFEQTLERFGRVDILVNNAGTNPVYGPVQEIDERAFDAIMDTNVKSIHFLSNFAREAMLKHGEGGAIINVSSVGGLLASDVIGGYSVSKAALIMLTQVQAKTWGKDGIRVNCIAPGLVKTEFARALWDDPKFLKASEQSAALGRIAAPDEMAGAVVYFASPASSFVTGQTLVMDGGRLL
jgi:NAD(P)-dependent dehydrogenase (short-subunit alcohol dehydrogenase family)